MSTMSVPARRNGSPLLTMSSAGNHLARSPSKVRIAPITSPALASAFNRNGMLDFRSFCGLVQVRAVLKGKRPYMREYLRSR